MSKRLFVGNLAQQITDEELGQAFAPYGAVRKAEVVRGRGGRGRGFGYVELASDEAVTRAIAELNGCEIHGRSVTVAEAQSSAPRTNMQEADQRFEFSRGRGFPGGNRYNRR